MREQSNVSGAEWDWELQYLERVRAEIQSQMEMFDHDLTSRQSNLVQFRKHFWDEISINVETPEDLLDTQVSIIQQSVLMKNQEHMITNAEQRFRRLRKQWPSPYFARIDFIRENETDRRRMYYIGIQTVAETHSGELLVYDWRAPVAELFYDFEPGPASYTSPEEEVSGKIALKRQYTIEQGQLLDMFDTGIHIVDQMLQRMLGKSADDKMKSIVTTIQKEQNAIIREDRYPLLVVQGTAGSGKTSVALQRVAYLLYKYRDRLEADQILLFSPNDIFNDYVSTVLPELGEQNMMQTTFQKYMEHRIGTVLKLEDAYDQLEGLLQVENDADAETRLDVIRFKGSEAFLELLNRYAAALASSGLKFVDYVAAGKVVLSKEELEHNFYHQHTALSVSRRLSKFQEWIEGVLEEKQKIWTRSYYRRLLKVPRYIGTEEELKARSRRKMKREFARLQRMTEQMQFIDILATYRSLFDPASWAALTSPTSAPSTEASTESTSLTAWADLAELQSRLPVQWDLICKHTLAQLEKDILPYEDSVPLFYLKEKLEGMQQFHRVHHVIIDEAQDYTPFQYELIKMMFPRSRMTLLGDLNQGILPASQNSYEFACRLWGDEQTKLVRLTRSYRSTAEITEWAGRLLPVSDQVESFARHGEAPQLIRVDSVEEHVQRMVGQITEWLRQGHGSIAIICRSAEESRRAYSLLGKYHSITLMHKHMKTYTGGLSVIPAYLAKGLEFDAVIVYDASRSVYYRENERKLFYTACTRAMHQLHLYYMDELTPFI